MTRLSERTEGPTRRTLLERTGRTAGALALGGTTLLGVAGADVEHGLGGVALAEGTLETGEMFKLTGLGDVELDGTCLTDESTGATLERYGIDYCAVEAEADLYVQPGRVQPESTGTYVIQSITPCSATDRAVVAVRPVQNPRSCLPGDWK